MLLGFWVPRVNFNSKKKEKKSARKIVKCCEANILLQIKTSAPVTHLSTEVTEAHRKNILRANPPEQPAAPSAITLTKKSSLQKNHTVTRANNTKWKHEGEKKQEGKMDWKIQWKEGVGGKRGIVGMQDCTSLRQLNYPMGWWFLLMRRLTFSCNPIPSNAMWCVWLASARALRGHGAPGPFAFGPQHPGNCLF